MPSQKQVTTRPPITTKGKGSSDSTALSSIFPGNPVNSSDMDDDKLRADFENLALNGEVKNGFGFSSFNRDYSEAPDYDKVETGGAGKPASPWVPNPGAPGVSTNPTDIPPAPDGYGRDASEGAYGGGPAVNPDAVSPKTAADKLKKTSLDGLKLGKSSFQE